MKKCKEPESNSDLFFTIERMAERCGIGENTLRNLITAGKIDHLMVGRKCLLTEDALRDFYERNKICAIKSPHTVFVMDAFSNTLIECRGINASVAESEVLVPWPCVEDQ